MDINNFIIEYWKNIASQNEMELKHYFHEDACIRWHNTNEQFNVSEFLRANCEYPGDWSGEVERIEQTGNIVITVTRVWAKEMSFHVTSFFEIIEEKIKTLDEYWGDDGTIPQWRKEMHIGKPIR
ncbi:MAG TPA: nuclear transport factor 2 family protein [Clostridiales bacterium]|jgi:hypothetical protein|nr:nuclear transport factor 2 family protein [Clostridiales bacterium]